ncbi:HtaA domain-containing protein [Corynebacterium auriscanis]|uniref:HtaA domain-containing protein n=1 Tax=Corynebacterium auriscanis TaxID=99807 RepID=UPI002245A81A|nr:HtaA domain-containing protein [Corynebacterium auriscanis]MCX2163518.1 HtaA domain-containing protein [Corynebacterium auriscanis]
MSRTATRGFIAASLAGAVAFSGMVVPLAHSAEPSTETTPALETGAFAWPIKASFLNHVQGPFARGTVTASGGAEFKGNQFVFPVNSTKTSLDAQGNGVIRLDGAAHLVAYRGLGPNGGPALDIKYSDLQLRVAGTRVSLIGDYALSGKTANEPTQLNNHGDDEILATFTVDAPIRPGTDFSAMDRPTAAGIGLQHSLLRYKEGEAFTDADVDLVLDYANDRKADDVTPVEPQGSATGSVGPSHGTANGSSTTGTIFGVIVALIAAVGGGALALGMAGWQGVLKNLGIRL